MQKKIALLVVLIIIVVGVWLYLFFTSPVKEELEETESPKVALFESEIKIAAQNRLVLGIATEKGFFEKEGLLVNQAVVPIEDRLSALLAGEVDYITVPGATHKYFIEAIKTSLRGAPIKTIFLLTRKLPSLLVAQPELKLNDLKTIGIISRHTPQHYQVLKFIKKNNLEVKIISLQEGTESSSLLSGQVDAVILSDVRAFFLQEQGFPVLATLVNALPEVVSVRDDKIEKEPEEIERMIRGLEQATEFILTRPEETKEFILRILVSGWNLEETEETLRMVEDLYYLIVEAISNPKDVPADKDMELSIKIVKAGEFETLQEVEEQIVTPEDLKKVFDFRFVK